MSNLIKKTLTCSSDIALFLVCVVKQKSVFKEQVQICESGKHEENLRKFDLLADVLQKNINF